MDIKNVIFDFGGVLLDWNPRYLYREHFKTPMEMEWFLAHICTTEWNSLQDGGRSLDEGTRLLQQEFPQYTDLIGLFYGQWEKMLHSDIPQTVTLLKKVKRAGYHVFGLTNWSAQTIGVAFERYDFFKEFDGIVISGVEKLLKPQPQIYQVLLDRYHLDAHHSFFIDDNPENTQAAEAMGFRTFLFSVDAISALEAILLKI